MREARKAEVDNNPHYLKQIGGVAAVAAASTKKRGSDATLNRNSSIESSKLPEIVPIELQSPLEIPGKRNKTRVDPFFFCKISPFFDNLCFI